MGRWTTGDLRADLWLAYPERCGPFVAGGWEKLDEGQRLGDGRSNGEGV